MQSLEELLGSKSKVKFLRFLSQSHDWQFNLSEISRKIGIDKGSLSRLIRELEQKGAIVTKRSGKLLLFRLNEKNALVIKSIIPLFKGESK